MRAIALRALPAAVAVLAVIAFAVPALLYPFGRDQAIVDYVAQRMLEGHLPYSAESAVVLRTPPTFAIFALADATLGVRQSSIRFYELATLLLTGWLVHRFLWSREGRSASTLAASILAVGGIYYLCFDYWDTAQQELWEGCALIAALAVARRDPRPLRRALACGALGALAVLFKYPAAVPVLLPFAVCTARSRRRAGGPGVGRAILWMAGGATLVSVLVALPFAIAGELPSLWECAVEYAVYYTRVSHPPGRPPFFWMRYCAWILSLGSGLAVAAAIVQAIRRRLDPELLLSISGVALGFASVAIQHVWCGYHWVVLVPFLAAALVCSVRTLIPSWPPLWAPAVALTLAIAALSPPRWAANPRMNYVRYTRLAWSHLLGHTDRRAFLAPFTGSPGFDYLAQEDVCGWIRERAEPGDTLCVVGNFEPLFYVLTGLRCPSRFPVQQGFAFKDGQWAREHAASLAREPPTFWITRSGHPVEQDLRKAGYAGTNARRFTVFRRPEKAGE